jgi:hypothetical protein
MTAGAAVRRKPRLPTVGGVPQPKDLGNREIENQKSGISDFQNIKPWDSALVGRFDAP